MSRGKTVLLAVLVIILGLAAFGYYFFTSGGAGLHRIVVNYLIPNLSDKKYTWIDFIYKGENSRVSGFYAWGDEKSFRIWTLSGLKRFNHQPGTSVYLFRDTCGVFRKIRESGEKGLINQEETFFDISEWNQRMKREYFVTVKFLGKNIIDKTWGVSGRYEVLGRIYEGVCD